MSTNCIRCVKNKRTGPDLLCDECRVPTASAPCKRCGKLFKPMWLDGLKKWSACCAACCVRNLCDSLGLPTPPELLDRHTKLPTLTRRDFLAQLESDEDEIK